MSLEGKDKKIEQQFEYSENKFEKELSLSEIDELLKERAGIFDSLDKFSKDEIYKKENFEDLRIAVDKTNDRFDEEAYAKAGFWKKFENFTRFGSHKERYDLIKSKDRGLLDKTKINKDVLGKGFKIEQGNNQEREYLESNVIDIRGDFKKDETERETVKSFNIDEADGEIIKIVRSGRTEKGQIEAAEKMREAEISRLEVVNGAELVGLKESMRKNAENKKGFLEMEGLLSPDGKEKIGAKLEEEENQIKELIKEREEKLAEETDKFTEPLEKRLKETIEMQNGLSKAFDFLKEEEIGLKKKIKEYEDGIKKTLKNFSGEIGADIIKDLEETKVGYEVRSKEFEERKVIISSKLDVLKNNKKEIEETLNRINNIGKTKHETGKDKKEGGKETESKETWDEVRDKAWGLNNAQETSRQVQPSSKPGEGRSYIDKLFEHYDDSAFEEANEADDKKKEAEKKVETKKRKKTSVKDKSKDAKGTKASKKTGESEKTESMVAAQIETQEKSGIMEDQTENVKFTDEKIKEIVVKELKTVGFMNNKKVAENSKDGLTEHLIGAVKNEILKSPEKVTEKFIKNEVDDWYKRLTKNLNKIGK